jgi:hypothetical protein
MKIITNDGLFKSTLDTHQATGEVGHLFEQTNRDIILERNRELRKSPNAMNDLSFGRQLASVPLEDWQWFMQQNPGYYQMPKKEKEKCLMNFLKNTDRGRASMVVDDQYKCRTKYFGGTEK